MLPSDRTLHPIFNNSHFIFINCAITPKDIVTSTVWTEHCHRDVQEGTLRSDTGAVHKFRTPVTVAPKYLMVVAQVERGGVLELQPPRAAKWPQINVLYGKKNFIHTISKNFKLSSQTEGNAINGCDF